MLAWWWQLVLWPVPGMSVPQIAGLVSADEDGSGPVRGRAGVAGRGLVKRAGLLVAGGVSEGCVRRSAVSAGGGGGVAGGMRAFRVVGGAGAGGSGLRGPG